MQRIARYAWLLFAGFPALLGAQGFGIYEQNTCTMARGGTAVAAPCADDNAAAVAEIFTHPIALIGLATHITSMANVAPELAVMIGLGVGVGGGVERGVGTGPAGQPGEIPKDVLQIVPALKTKRPAINARRRIIF